MSELQRYVRVDFDHFKAFQKFTIHLRNFNILVGPNNAGKSTVLAAFRILSAGMRRAMSRKPQIVSAPNGKSYGYVVDLSAISVAAENIFFNYDDSRTAVIKFTLSNKNELILYFPEQGSCHLLAINSSGKTPHSPKEFERHFNAPIGFVPILGPVDHQEQLYEKEAARLALFNYRAARNFRNIWHHYPERFDEFRQTLARTWPGMDIEPPIVEWIDKKLFLYMFCPEFRIPREIFWSGFGFQVWCQMLTHLIQSKNNSIFLIDEPDIYLHSELQRQLLSLLRNLGPDVLIATHSTEIITESEADEIIIVNKKRTHAQRVKNTSQLSNVFSSLGSNLNPILTQLAKTKRALFVEGKDYQIIGKFASKLGYTEVGNRSSFAVIPVEGFNPERAKNIKLGMEMTLGTDISSAVVFDRDYRSNLECEAIKSACMKFCKFATLHNCKEIENFLLVPSSLDRAVLNRIAENVRRGGQEVAYHALAREILENFAHSKKSYVAAQYVANRKQFERSISAGINDATINELALSEFEDAWVDENRRVEMIPGKEAFSELNKKLQELAGISITPTLVIDVMKKEEISPDMNRLIEGIARFGAS